MLPSTMHAIETSKLADLVRAAVAAFEATNGSGRVVVRVRIEPSAGDVHQGGTAPELQTIILRRLYTGRHKSLEAAATVDVLVGRSEGKNDAPAAFAFDGLRRYHVTVAAASPELASEAFEGVFSIRKLGVADVG